MGRVVLLVMAAAMIARVLTASVPAAAQDEDLLGDALGSVDSLEVAPVPPELEGAFVSLSEGDYASAAVELGALVAVDTANTGAMRLLASAYAKLEAYTQAIQVCRMLAAIDSADAGVRAALGHFHQRQGDFQLAEMYYRQALELDKDLLQAYQGLGWIYLQRKELERTLEMVTRTTERAPDYGPNYILMGRALTAQGFYESAMRAYERAFLLSPELRERYGILLQELAIRHELGR